MKRLPSLQLRRMLLLLITLTSWKAVCLCEVDEIKLVEVPDLNGIPRDLKSLVKFFRFKPFDDMKNRIEGILVETVVGGEKTRGDKTHSFAIARLLHSLFALLRLPVGFTEGDKKGTTASMQLQEKLNENWIKTDFKARFSRELLF